MGYSNVVQEDCSGLRVSIKAGQILPYWEGIEGVVTAEKYNATTGTVTDPYSESKDCVLLPGAAQANNPFLTSPVTSFNGKPGIFFSKDTTPGQTKPLRRAINYTGNKFTSYLVFQNNNTQASTVSRVLWQYQGTDGKSIQIWPSGTNSKIAIVVNGVRTELANTSLANQFKIFWTYTFGSTPNTGELKVYVNPTDFVTPTVTLTGLSIDKFVGNIHLGSDNNGSTIAHTYLGAAYTFKKVLSAAENIANLAALTAYYG